LLNNQLVSFLPLLVSLLSACNGTTGGGNPEVSVQSNAPSTNTTSIPTPNAENLPPATGDAVRVPRWSRDPKAPVLLAPLTIRLAIVNNCLVGQNNPGDPPALVLFPYDKGVWDDTTRTFTFGDQVIRIGEFIELTGGSLQNFDELKVHGKYYVPDCGANYFFRAF
jgi:hypothetical protein